ncbi:MAG: hypothetical protein EZS28_030303 [Streblomastix strix]|uniref:Uncharacterized protein n=1 Tax=Streblomastix strix TaxID=222440 RepID=A0A5J4UWB7_9EUKA|nr:MAG: hypothetical protein EZS28_030303 [Streblomastix strix]
MDAEGAICVKLDRRYDNISELKTTNAVVEENLRHLCDYKMPIAGINEDEEYIDQDLLFDMYLDFMCSCRLAFKSETSKKFWDFWRASIRLARLQPDTPIEQILQIYNRQQNSEKIRLKCNGLILNMLEPMQDQYCSIQIDAAKILSYHVAIAVIVFPFLGTKPFFLTSYIGSGRKVNYLDFGVRLFNLLQSRGI